MILASIVSNHKPIVIQFQDTLDYGPFPFRYNLIFLVEKEVLKIIIATQRNWITRAPIFIWEQKYKLVKFSLKEWAQSSYFPPSTKIDMLRSYLEKTYPKI
jgi:hypothetical protein